MRVILKLILKKAGVKTWNEFVLPRIRCRGGIS
jgi:hypothetical protein